MRDAIPEEGGEDVVLALAVRDGALADRLATLLGSIPGLRLARLGEPPDVTLTDSAADVAGCDVGADPGLTPRESEVLSLLAEGASNKAIARRLGISVHTVKFHARRLFDKLDATGRTDAVAQAARSGILHL